MKPRARYNPYGNGFWTVRSLRGDGYIIQGVGATLEFAFWDWVRTEEYVRYLT